MWERKLFGLLLFLVLSAPCFSQSFEDSKVYQVSGTELNALQRDLQIAKNELETLKIKNEQLVRDSENKAKALEELQVQLTMVSKSSRESQNEVLKNELIIGGGYLLTGLAIGYIVHR